MTITIGRGSATLDQTREPNRTAGNYRAYLLDDNGRVAKAFELDCGSDAEAISAAERLVDGCSVELWERARLIARFPEAEPYSSTGGTDAFSTHPL